MNDLVIIVTSFTLRFFCLFYAIKTLESQTALFQSPSNSLNKDRKQINLNNLHIKLNDPESVLINCIQGVLSFTTSHSARWRQSKVWHETALILIVSWKADMNPRIAKESNVFVSRTDGTRNIKYNFFRLVEAIKLWHNTSTKKWTASRRSSLDNDDVCECTG